MLRLFSKTYYFKMAGLPSFSWEKDETKCIQYGRMQKSRGKQPRQVAYKNRFIPCAYTRVIDQFCKEVLHAEYNASHEAQRRASYAQRILNATGEELDGDVDLEEDGTEAAAWRSTVLTPILQRYLYGIPDSYAPAVYDALLPPSPGMDPDKALTIGDVTRFYLGRDPTLPSLASIYFRNLVYRWEARWHLAVAFGRADINDVNCYGNFIQNQKVLIKNATKPQEPGDGIPPLTLTEYATVLCEGIELPFAKLKPAVSTVVLVHIALGLIPPA